MKDFTTEQIQQYQSIINNTKDGEYELENLFNSIWKQITPTTFGKQFKNNCDRGIFDGITYLSTKTNNHHLYKIS